MIKTVITGGNGFIGKALVNKLSHSIHLEHKDIGKWKFDAEQVLFLSTYGNMSHHKKHGEMINANVHNLLSILEGNHCGWMCYMSSSSVLLPVQTPYSRTKRAAEEILQALPELKSCIVRPYSVTGAGEQKEHLIPTLIRSCMEGEEMPLAPNAVHDFVDVEDVVDGLILLADAGVTGIHEFGNCHPYSNQEICAMVENACGKPAHVKIKPFLRSYDSYEWYCKHPSPLWKSKKTIGQSISEMVEAYKNEHA